MIKTFCEFINEGVDFKDNFTPLYHFTSFLDWIMETDTLRASNKVRGPFGISFTRSKFFWNDQKEGSYSSRLILNYDLLKQDGYKSYPIDEWALKGDLKGKNLSSYLQYLKGVFSNKSKNTLPPGTKRPWWAEHIKGRQFGKSNFSHFKSGKRGTAHGIESLPKDIFFEYEFEERILKDIKPLGKYIYGINILNNLNTKILQEYLKKYPHIKLYTGTRFLKEISLDEFKQMMK